MNKQPLIQQIVLGMQKTDSPSDYWLSENLPVEFPELESAKELKQRGHKTVLDHTMAVIDHLSVKNPITLLSGLFHDLGKCNVILDPKQQFDSEFYNHHYDRRSKFANHEIESIKIARIRLTHWQASEYFIDRVCRLISTHMCDIMGLRGESALRNFVAKVGVNDIENWFVLRKADSASYSEYGKYKRYIIDPFYDAVKKYLDGLSQGDNLLQSNQNINIGGKGHKDGRVSLSIKSANQKERKNP